METSEMLLKQGLLYIFCLLNAVDMAQTVSFVRMGIESNPSGVYPLLWFPLKILFTFGLPLGLYRLDLYLDNKGEEGFHGFLKTLVGVLYFLVLVADIYYLFLVVRNMFFLGGRLVW